MTDYQCPSCGGFCRKSGCERSIYNVGEKYHAIHLEKLPSGMCIVSVEHNGKFIPVIRDNGDVISHYVEPSGIVAAIRARSEKENSK